MTPERWSAAKAIFDAALDHDTAERPQVIARLAGGDEGLELEVLSLLESHQRRDTLLDLPEQQSEMTHPQRVGAYRVIRPVGNGGAGIVYEAERADDQFHQRVALKLLHPTAATKAAMQRFLRERQLLASLEHPNLPRLIDGGVTTDGFPYLVMEFVAGEPLLSYCGRNQLGVRQRLGLFLAICEAVEYAHHRLVVHRDIKPANVLVDETGRPRLLDFGIAKLVDANPGGSSTATGLSTYTPAYASPEQIRGELPAVSMDVYSLGVLLFELLSGKHPLGSVTTANEWVRRVLETSPRRLSDSAPAQTRAELHGDLDAICARAMQKDASLRYRSVTALADDVRAHLCGSPIAARRGQTIYVVSRFVRRNVVPLTATILVLASLCTALILVNHESRRAERSYHAARRSLNAILAEAVRRDIPASARKGMLSMAAGYIELLDAESARDADAAYERIQISLSLAGLYGEAYASNLGDLAKAEEITRNAIDLALQGDERFPSDKRFLEVRAGASIMLGDVLVGQRQWPQALAAYGQARELILRLPVSPGAERQRISDLSVIDSMCGDVLLEQGDAAQSLAIQEEVLRARRELAQRSGERQDLFGVASAELSRGNALLALGRPQDAAGAYEAAARSFGDVKVDYEDPTYVRQSWLVATLRHGDALNACRKASAARRIWQSALGEATLLYRDDPQSALAVGNLNQTRRRLGIAAIDSQTPSLPDPRLSVTGLP